MANVCSTFKLLPTHPSKIETRFALTRIINHAIYPASEPETARRIRENSAVCELTSYPLLKITKDKLYKSSLKLFDIEDKIYIYYLNCLGQIMF